MLKVVPLVLFAGAAAFVSTSTLRDARTDAALTIPVVTVHAKDFAFEMPKSIPAGQTSFRLINDGKELHHLTIIRLADGKTLADFTEAMKAGPPPKWATAVGGPNAAMPGKTAEATLNLEAGNYVLVCFIPSPGEETPHAMKGMIQPLIVTPAGVVQAGGPVGVTAPDPKPDVHLELKEYGFAFSKPITAGKHTIHVMNQGAQDHEVVLVKLAPGKHAADFTDWAMTGMKGPPPGEPMDGMAAMATGRTAIFSNDFTPGMYAAVCFVTDEVDHKLHTAHGMSVEFEVK
ncbi:MAG TPA: hypothetical protein VKA54_17890 [Gemmatimonadaceae bacterium]|nr:hypothetical protein [Gemmatimonadaceae bacterium]